MSVDRLVYVSCDRCDGWPTDPVIGRAAEARRQARHEGYVYRNGQDLCPDCQRELEDESDGEASRVR